MSLAGLGGIAFLLVRPPPGVTPTIDAALIGLAALLVLAAAWRLWLHRPPWMVLYSDRLERRQILGWRALRRDQILGLRPAGRDSAGAWFEVAPKDPRQTGVRLKVSLLEDPVVADWFLGAPDLKAEAIAQDLDAILRDPAYGLEPAEREGRLKQAHAIAQIFNIAVGIATICIFIGLAPMNIGLGLAVLALLAGVILVAAFKGLITWRLGWKARPTIAAAWAPAIALAMSPMSQIAGAIPDQANLIHATAIAVAIVAGAITAMRLRSWRRWGVACMVAIATGSSLENMATLADIGLDASAARLSPTTVFYKSITGSDPSVYNLYLAASSGRPAGWNAVSRSLYLRTVEGSLLCWSIHSGALGLPWRRLEDCPLATRLQFQASQKPAPYPERAWRDRMSGRAVVQCKVKEDRLADCHVLSETPAGYGFGAAALAKVAGPNSGLNPARLRGLKLVDVPVVFKTDS
jgi:hypothetical protein